MAAAQDFKRTAMELGGKNPLIVLRDYDLDEAVKTAGLGAFSNQGQLCMATSRILVEEPLYEAFCGKLRDYALSLKVGDPTAPDVFIGPLIDERHCAFVRSQVDDAVSKGAKLLCGGTHDGPFFRPTVLCGVDERYPREGRRGSARKVQRQPLRSFRRGAHARSGPRHGARHED